MQKEVIANYETSSCKLIVNYGFVGSAGESLYKQRMDFDELVGKDHSLLIRIVIQFIIVDGLINTHIPYYSAVQ